MRHLGFATILGVASSAPFDPVTAALAGTPNGTGSGVANVGPFTPAVNSWLFAFALTRRGGSITAVAKCTISGGPTWTERADAVQALASPTSARATCWTGNAGPAPTPMTVGIASTNANQVFLVIVEVPVCLNDFANVGGGININGDPAPALATTPLSTSLLLAATSITLDENLGVPPANPFLATPADWTNLYNASRAIGTSQNPIAVQVISKQVSDPGVNTPAWISAGFISASVIIEVKRGSMITGPAVIDADVSRIVDMNNAIILSE